MPKHCLQDSWTPTRSLARLTGLRWLAALWKPYCMLVVAGRQQIQRQFQFTEREVSGIVICDDLILLEVFKEVKKVIVLSGVNC
jgi:hypothetical protein